MPSNKWTEKHQSNLDSQRERFTGYYERNPEDHSFDPSNSFPETNLLAEQIMSSSGSVAAEAEETTLHMVQYAVRGPSKNPKYKFVDKRDGKVGVGGDMLIYDHKIESINYGRAYYQVGVTGDDPHTSGKFYLDKIPKSVKMINRGFVKSTQTDDGKEWVKKGPSPGNQPITKYLYVRSIEHSYLEIDFEKITKKGQAPKRKKTTIEFSDPGDASINTTEAVNLAAPRWKGPTRNMRNGKFYTPFGEPPSNSYDSLENINPQDLWTDEDKTIGGLLCSRVMEGSFDPTKAVGGSGFRSHEKEGLEQTFEREYEEARSKIEKAYKKGKLTEEKSSKMLEEIRGGTENEDGTPLFAPNGPTASVSETYYHMTDIEGDVLKHKYQFGWLDGTVRLLQDHKDAE